MSDSGDPIKNFADLAYEYCSWAENLADPSDDDLKRAHRLLCELQLNALSLPDLDSEDTNDQLTKEDWMDVRTRFQKFNIDQYWKVFDVFADSEGPVLCTISDDLADIYRDLKEGLILFDRGKVNEAVWEWRFNYFIHWGRHLTGAQSAIHQYPADILL